MTKWARMRRRKERKKVEALKSSEIEGEEVKLAELENDSPRNNHSEETKKLEKPNNSQPNPILAQIPRYVYVIAIFALLSGVFFPLITTGAEEAFNFVIGGTATLLLGLAGGIVLFKATTSDKRQGILLSIGSALIAISLVLIFQIHDWFRSVFF